MTPIKQIQLQKSLHTLIESNPPIIKMEVPEYEFLEVEDILEVRKANLTLSENKPFCVLLDTRRGYFNVSKEANKLLAGKEYAEKRMAAALLSQSLATKLASNFFINFSKPITPTRVFSTEEEAINWLKKVALQNKEILPISFLKE